MRVLCADALDALRDMAEDSVDALVTDPPAGIAFMGKEWDKPSDHGISSYGFTDGGERKPGVSVRESRNPTCGTCGKRQRGWKDVKPCDCEKPDFAREAALRLNDRRMFIASLTPIFAECLRVLKPGAHGVVWALPRTSHWTATALEDAGFEIRDVVTHLFGSGFPKSLNIATAIDKASGKIGHRGKGFNVAGVPEDKELGIGFAFPAHEPITDDAKKWSGWGTALKPASEHWIVVRKPLSEKSVAANVLKHGTGALNIDACRIAGTLPNACKGTGWATQDAANAAAGYRPNQYYKDQEGVDYRPHNDGRWPANVVLSHGFVHVVKFVGHDDPAVEYLLRRFFDGYDGVRAMRERVGRCARADCGERDASSRDSALEVLASDVPPSLLKFFAPTGEVFACERIGEREVKGSRIEKPSQPTPQSGYGGRLGGARPARGIGDEDGNETQEVWDCVPGCAVAQLDAQSGESVSTASVRNNHNKGSDDWGARGTFRTGPLFSPHCDRGGASRFFYVAKPSSAEKQDALRTLSLFDADPEGKPEKNAHVTVKPVALMQHLIRLVCPPGGLLLDCFAGSGTTGVAAAEEGVSAILVERDPDSAATATARCARAAAERGYVA